MGRTFFRRANLIDGVNPPKKNATVVVDGERIAAVGTNGDAPKPGPQDIVYGLAGRSLMPGMVQCHYHVAYDNIGDMFELDMKHPPTMLTLIAAKNAELLLRSGFTGAVGAGTLHNIDVTLKRAINQGMIPGPRFVACGRDVVTTGDSVDFHPSWWKLQMEGLGRICDGADEFRKAVREEIKQGVDIIKLYPTGGHGLHWPADVMTMTVEEIKAAIPHFTLEQRAELARCLHAWEDDDWDRQMKRDLVAGKMDKLLKKVDVDIAQGNPSDLP